MMLAKLSGAAQSPQGYLVEHHRVGKGNTLHIEYRDGNPSVFTENYQPTTIEHSTKQVCPELAGVMIITRYTMDQAEATWRSSILPALDDFVKFWDKLETDESLLNSYNRCADGHSFYEEQTKAV